MENTFIDEIKLKVWIKGKHFYKKRHVQIHNGIFRYYSTSSAKELRFQADLLDFIIIEQNINKDKPELMLTSKVNAFSPLIIYHENKDTLLNFKQEIEQMMEWEREKSEIQIKNKKLAEIVQKYSLINIFHLSKDIKNILNAQYQKYKSVHDTDIETNNIERIKRIDTQILSHDKIKEINEYKSNDIKAKINHQVLLVYAVGLFASLLILFNWTNEGYLYQIIFVLLIIFGLPQHLKLFVQNNVHYINNNQISIDNQKQSHIIIVNEIMSINIFQLLDYLGMVLRIISIEHNNKKITISSRDNKLEVYIEARIKKVIVIERKDCDNTILSIYVLQSIKLQTQTVLYSYALSLDDYIFNDQQHSFHRIIVINNLIKLKHEESFFNHKESYLFDEELEFKIEDRNDIELKMDKLFDSNMYVNKSYLNEQSLDYNEIISYQCDNILDAVMLKEDVIVILDKELVKLFLSNCSNLIKVNKLIKQANQICDESIIEIVIELTDIGDISFKAKYEVGDKEINKIKYTIISFINTNEDIKIIEHFGFYIWKTEYKTHISSWVMFENIGNEKAKQKLLSAMKIFLRHNNQIEENIQHEIDKLISDE